MDNDKLLHAIYNKPALWDKSNEGYYNQDLKTVLWTEVTREVGANYETVKYTLGQMKNCFLSKPNLQYDILCFKYALAAKQLVLGNSTGTLPKAKRKPATKESKELTEKIKIRIIEAVLEDDRDDYYGCEYTNRPVRAITYTY